QGADGRRGGQGRCGQFADPVALRRALGEQGGEGGPVGGFEAVGGRRQAHGDIVAAPGAGRSAGAAGGGRRPPAAALPRFPECVPPPARSSVITRGNRGPTAFLSSHRVYTGSETPAVRRGRFPLRNRGTRRPPVVY